MSYSLVIKPEVEADLHHAMEWYEEQRTGLGEEFVLEVEATLDRIIENPMLYAVVHRDIRRALTKPLSLRRVLRCRRQFRRHIGSVAREA